MLFILQFILFLTNSQSVFAGLRIYGGRDVNENELPYVVAMRRQIKTKNQNGEIKTNYYFFCSGTLLSATWCLTATHCTTSLEIKNYTNKEIKSVITNQDLNKVSEIIWSIKYPAYRNNKFNHIYPNDISLVHSEPMILKQYMRLSALDYTTLLGFEALSVGYGVNDTNSMKAFGAPNLNMTLKALKVVVARCPKFNGLCTVPSCASFGKTCMGDSGGPVVHHSGLVGVTSAGYPGDCDISHSPYMYNLAIPISPFIDWITTLIA